MSQDQDRQPGILLERTTDILAREAKNLHSFLPLWGIVDLNQSWWLPDVPLSFVIIAAVLTLARRQAKWRARSKGCPLPPSRQGWPVLGNVLDLAAVLGKEWEAYIEWGKELGSDMIYVDAMGQSIIVLNTKELADSLLEKQSSILSSRPTTNMVKHLGWDWALPLYPYGEGFRYRRKLFQQHFHPSDNQLHRERSTRFLHKNLITMLQRPSDIQTINKDLVSAIMCSLAYGIDIYKRPSYFKVFEDAIQHLTEIVIPGRFMIDFIPWLKYVPEWMPGAAWQRYATLWRQQQVQFIEAPFKEALQRYASGGEDLPVSFVSLALGHEDDDRAKSVHASAVKEVAAMFYAAGSETTISVLNFMFLTLVLHPDVQKRAQKELDDYLVHNGHIRLPEADDAQHLPYLRAIVKEILRWQPVTPIGVPHLSTEDYVHNGYFIPEGSIIIANAWAMLRNDDIYPDAHSFKPERFLNQDGTLSESVPDPEEVIFGFGRRKCPGQHIGLATLFLTASTVLLLFDICKPTDENGNEFTPKLEATCGIARSPTPFKCNLKPRSEAAVALIESLDVD